jgi:hypothetical protein
MAKTKNKKKKVSHRVEVNFQLRATVEQTVEIYDPKITAEKLRDGLESGKYQTGIVKGNVVVTKKGKIVGRVSYVDTFDEVYESFSAENYDDDLDNPLR